MTYTNKLERLRDSLGFLEDIERLPRHTGGISFEIPLEDMEETK